MSYFTILGCVFPLHRRSLSAGCTAALLFGAPGSAQQTSSDSICAYKGVIVVGSETLCSSVSGNILARSAANPTPSEARKIIQFGLNALGFGGVDVDGVVGPQTLNAVQRFNTAKGFSGAAFNERLRSPVCFRH